jgi:hypothetical protein
MGGEGEGGRCEREGEREGEREERGRKKGGERERGGSRGSNILSSEAGESLRHEGNKVATPSSVMMMCREADRRMVMRSPCADAALDPPLWIVPSKARSLSASASFSASPSESIISLKTQSLSSQSTRIGVTEIKVPLGYCRSGWDTRGLGWRIHWGVEIAESSTNKQMMMSFICSCRNKTEEPSSIYTLRKVPTIRGSLEGLTLMISRSRMVLAWPTPHTTPFFLPPEDPFPVLLRHNSTPLWEPDPALARRPRQQQAGHIINHHGSI